MTAEKRQQTIDSWHLRADAYEVLVNNYQIFTEMAMEMVEFVEQNRLKDEKDFHIMDLAAGTGLISKLLIENLHLSPSSLYLVEPAEQMCIRARNNIQTPHIYQITAEDCLSQSDLPRNSFDFILCNASMHLMSESEIYPIVSQLLKPKKGYFLYTLWYHSFDETQDYDQDDEFERCFNDVLTDLNYPKYFPQTSQRSPSVRSRRYLKETALQNGLNVESCIIYMHQIPLSFDLDFMLMSPNWLIEHLKTYEWTQREDIHVMKERIIEKVREVIKDKYTEKPIVQIIVSRMS
jgi:SAM-dependent methyltransferase